MITAPSRSTDQWTDSQPVSRNQRRFSSTITPRPTRAAPPSAMRTGVAMAWCSHIAGLGVRSGQLRPSTQKSPSCGRSPKSPPYAQRTVPAGSRWCRPWSRNSQMKPPWSPGVDSIASQYSASVPLLLPIACEYSHMMNGYRWRPERACATIAEMGGYMGQAMSLAD